MISKERKKCELNNVTIKKQPMINGIDYKPIKLSGIKSNYVKVSIEDHDMLSKYTWHLNSNGEAENEDNITMGDLLMKPVDECYVHHIDGNNLNYIRTNLEYSDCKKIKLSNCHDYVLVSYYDYDMLSKYKWYVNKKGDVVNDDNIIMSHLLMDPPKGHYIIYKIAIS
jgi:hypothetical protein